MYNKEKNKEYKNRYRNKNRERVLLLEKEARKRNKDYYLKYKEKNKDKIKENYRLWLESNKEKIRGYQRKRQLKKLYSLTELEYEETLKQQQNQCAICLKPQITSKRRFAVDHCHKTGKNRGILCYKCNIGLGYFDDDVQKLQYAIYYINSYIVKSVV